MTLTLELTPERERQLQQEATKRGQDPGTYALSLLQSAMTATTLYEQRTHEERTRAFLDWVASHVDTSAPPIPMEALRRENPYED